MRERVDHHLLESAERQGDEVVDSLLIDLIKDGRFDSIRPFLFEVDDSAAIPDSLELSELYQSLKDKIKTYDSNRILKGQQFFLNNSMEIMSLLGIMSLPYCITVTPGNKVLCLSEKLRENPAKWLTDTASFVMHVSVPNAFSEEGMGLRQIFRTRLIHAATRYHLENGNWHDKRVKPLNQEDMAWSNLAFSWLVLKGLHTSGKQVSDEESGNFLYLWKCIGELMGIKEELLTDSPTEAARMSSLIEKRSFLPSEEARRLACSLVEYYKTRLPSGQAALVESQIRYYTGDQVADLLGLRSVAPMDLFVEVINGIRELKNLVGIHQPSYLEYLRNYREMIVGQG